LIRRSLIALTIVTALTASVAAQLAVYDPVNHVTAISQLIQLEDSVVRLVQIYTQLRSQYQHMVQQATRIPVDMNARYRGLRTPWRALTGADTYGSVSGWIDASNTGWEVAAAYQRSTQRLRSYDGGLGTFPAEIAARVRASYGTVELTDAVTAQSLWTVGRLRNHSGPVEQALRALEDDSYSTAPALNTQAALLNKINAAGLTQARMTQDTNNLLLSLLEQHLVDAKRQRDSETERINADVVFQREARLLLARTTTRTTEALQTFRLP
jgi:hypothetical protein